MQVMWFHPKWLNNTTGTLRAVRTLVIQVYRMNKKNSVFKQSTWNSPKRCIVPLSTLVSSNFKKSFKLSFFYSYTNLKIERFRNRRPSNCSRIDFSTKRLHRRLIFGTMLVLGIEKTRWTLQVYPSTCRAMLSGCVGRGVDGSKLS